MEDDCAICLNSLGGGQALGQPEACDHCFCALCIQEWAAAVNTCPIDRRPFTAILVRNRPAGPVVLRKPVPNRTLADIPPEEDEDATFCEVCGRADQEDRMLLCDGCDCGIHMHCLDPPLTEVPPNQWFCPECAPEAPPQPQAGSSTQNHGRARAIPRTEVAERIRLRVAQLLMMESTDEDEEEEEEEDEPPQPQEYDPAEPVLSGDEEAGPSAVKTKKVAKPRRRRVPIKRRRRRRRRKSKKRGGGKSEGGARSRIQKSLGISPPASNRFLPTMKGREESAPAVPAAPLSLFGSSTQLFDFDESDPEEDDDGNSFSVNARLFDQPITKTSIEAQRRRAAEILAKRKAETAAKRPSPSPKPTTPACSSQSGDDLLGGIMESQKLLSTPSHSVQIKRDGTLEAKKPLPKQEEPKPKEESTKSSRPRWESPKSSSNGCLDTNIPPVSRSPTSAPSSVIGAQQAMDNASLEEPTCDTGAEGDDKCHGAPTVPQESEKSNPAEDVQPAPTGQNPDPLSPEKQAGKVNSAPLIPEETPSSPKREDEMHLVLEEASIQPDSSDGEGAEKKSEAASSGLMSRISALVAESVHETLNKANSQIEEVTSTSQDDLAGGAMDMDMEDDQDATTYTFGNGPSQPVDATPKKKGPLLPAPPPNRFPVPPPPKMVPPAPFRPPGPTPLMEARPRLPPELQSKAEALARQNACGGSQPPPHRPPPPQMSEPPPRQPGLPGGQGLVPLPPNLRPTSSQPSTVPLPQHLLQNHLANAFGNLVGAPGIMRGPSPRSQPPSSPAQRPPGPSNQSQLDSLAAAGGLGNLNSALLAGELPPGVNPQLIIQQIQAQQQALAQLRASQSQPAPSQPPPGILSLRPPQPTSMAGGPLGNPAVQAELQKLAMAGNLNPDLLGILAQLQQQHQQPQRPPSEPQLSPEEQRRRMEDEQLRKLQEEAMEQIRSSQPTPISSAQTSVPFALQQLQLHQQQLQKQQQQQQQQHQLQQQQQQQQQSLFAGLFPPGSAPGGMPQIRVPLPPSSASSSSSANAERAELQSPIRQQQMVIQTPSGLQIVNIPVSTGGVPTSLGLQRPPMLNPLLLAQNRLLGPGGMQLPGLPPHSSAPADLTAFNPALVQALQHQQQLRNLLAAQQQQQQPPSTTGDIPLPPEQGDIQEQLQKQANADLIQLQQQILIQRQQAAAAAAASMVQEHERRQAEVAAAAVAASTKNTQPATPTKPSTSAPQTKAEPSPSERKAARHMRRQQRQLTELDKRIAAESGHSLPPEAKHMLSNPKSGASGGKRRGEQEAGPSSEDKRPKLRFSEKVSVDGGDESPRSLASPAPDYSPNLLPHQEGMAEGLSKSERKKKRKEQKLKKLLAEATSTTNEDEFTSTSTGNKERKEELLGKFNYQLRVEEEVKAALRGYYSTKKIDKDQYKDIMRKTVPKICKKKGSINPIKIQEFVGIYVQKAVDEKRAKKKS